MEKQLPLQPLTPQEVESLIEDFQSGSASRQSKWIPSRDDPLSLLDLVLYPIARRDFPLLAKQQLLVFLDEFSHLLVPSPTLNAAAGLSSVLESVRAVVLSGGDASVPPYWLKEQALISATSVAIAVDAIEHASRQLESLVELLLTVINRPNFGADRQTRAIACECLRELENSYPCLLSEIVGHIWGLCQNERTHASQSYMLLLTSVIHSIVKEGGLPSTVSILSTSVQLVPFNIPSYVRTLAAEGKNRGEHSSGDGYLKDIRKVMAFLLERPQILTPLATMEMVSMLMTVVSVLELHGSVVALLKVQFFGLLYSYDPVLCHVVLMMYSHFSDAFAGDEQRIVCRLALMAKEAHHPLVFRLLALHWLLGVASSRPPDRKRLLLPMASSFYPAVFDPLALKAVKLDGLANIADCLDTSNGDFEEKMREEEGGKSVVKLIEDGLVCVSAFKWLPVDSTETSVAFRMLHKFLVGAAPHSDSAKQQISVLLKSRIFHTLQTMLVDLALENSGLVPVVAAFLDRLMECKTHKLAGERLLQIVDEFLLPKLTINYQLSLYFPIFDRIAKNDTIPPRGLLELLTKLMFFLAKEHGPDTGLRSWSQGSKVLNISRTMLMHHKSSRVFLVLSRLLMFTCQFFPDLGVRDNARIYLRMLLCVPGEKLRNILNFGNQVLSASPSQHPGSLFQVPSPRPSQNLKKSPSISSYIHLERVIPLLVNQSWSLTIQNLGAESSKPGYFEVIRDVSFGSETKKTVAAEGSVGMINSPKEPLRVVDSDVAEILDVLRKHFSCIPDFRHLPGLKIKIRCTLRFESEPFSRAWGLDLPSHNSDGFDGLPALYASVVKFSSTSKYGSIPSCRVPFLLGEPLGTDRSITPIGNGSQESSTFRASVVIELEPQEPMPGLIDVAIEANGENGQIICGSLQNIGVGIEDMFLKAHIPSDIPEEYAIEYYMDLFHALWEACGNSANIGRETFPLKGGKGVAAISGTTSVKLIEVPASCLIRSVEQYLAPFVVSVIGSSLVDAVRNKGVIQDVVWKEDTVDHTVVDNNALVPYSEVNPLQLLYIVGENDADNQLPTRKMNIGCFLILIFLPPRFHLLFQMEVCHSSTLVRIRTDHWPCLAYIDEYLEALFYR